MRDVGRDYHERYTQLNAIDAKGQKRASARLANDYAEIERFV